MAGQKEFDVNKDGREEGFSPSERGKISLALIDRFRATLIKTPEFQKAYSATHFLRPISSTPKSTLFDLGGYTCQASVLMTHEVVRLQYSESTTNPLSVAQRTAIVETVRQPEGTNFSDGSFSYYVNPGDGEETQQYSNNQTALDKLLIFSESLAKQGKSLKIKRPEAKDGMTIYTNSLIEDDIAELPIQRQQEALSLLGKIIDDPLFYLAEFETIPGQSEEDKQPPVLRLRRPGLRLLATNHENNLSLLSLQYDHLTDLIEVEIDNFKNL